jgi:hypothetical protein
MKPIQSIFLCTAFLAACAEPTEGEKRIETQFPKILNDCLQESMFLETNHSIFGNFYVVDIITETTDSVEIKCGTTVFEFTLEGDSSIKHFVQKSDSSVIAKHSIDHWNYPYLDSMAIYLDTTQVITTVLLYRDPLLDYGCPAVKVTRAHPVFVQNLSVDTVAVLQFMSGQLQFKDRNGAWQNYLDCSVSCSTGVHHLSVAPGEYIVFLIPITRGKYKKEMRVSIGDYHSKSFWGNCNFKF